MLYFPWTYDGIPIKRSNSLGNISKNFHPSEDINNTEQWKPKTGGGYVYYLLCTFYYHIDLVGKKTSYFLSCEILH